MASRVANQTLQKSTNDGIPRLSDLVTNDGGTTDLFDLQYLMFNIIAMAFVLNGVAHATLDGFPQVPTTLWLLTAGPAAVYVSNKAFGTNTPLIFSVSPARVKALDQFTVYGQNFLPAGADKTKLQVLVNGSNAQVDPVSVSDTSIRVTVPRDVGAPDTPIPIAVIAPSGVPAFRDAALTIVKIPMLLPLGSTVKVGPGGQFTLQGTWTLSASGAPPAVLVEGVAAITSSPVTSHAINVTVPSNIAGGDRQVDVMITDDTGTSDPVKLTIS